VFFDTDVCVQWVVNLIGMCALLFQYCSKGLITSCFFMFIDVIAFMNVLLLFIVYFMVHAYR